MQGVPLQSDGALLTRSLWQADPHAEALKASLDIERAPKSLDKPLAQGQADARVAAAGGARLVGAPEGLGGLFGSRPETVIRSFQMASSHACDRFASVVREN